MLFLALFTLSVKMPSVPGAHTGILREENIVLRQVFGYGAGLDTTPLRTVLQLPDSSVRDILLVSIDVDTGGGYEVISPGQSFHIGVSIFYMRRLAHMSSTNPREAIASYQFINQDTNLAGRQQSDL